MRAFGTGLPVLVQHADADLAAGLHPEVDRAHVRVDPQFLHVRRPALGGDDDLGRPRLAAAQRVDPVAPRRRLADVVEELGADERPGDRLPRLVGDRPVTVRPRSRTIFAAGSRPRSRPNSPRVQRAVGGA